MTRIFQFALTPVCLCILTVTGYAQGGEIAKSTLKLTQASRRATQFTVPIELPWSIMRNITGKPFNHVTFANNTVTPEHNPYGLDLYTALEQRMTLADLLSNPASAGSHTPRSTQLPTVRGTESVSQSAWAQKGLLITQILARENPAELEKLAQRIPDFAQKITDQDVLFLTLTKRYQALSFLAKKDADFRTVFEQPDLKQAPGQIRPDDLVRNMAWEGDETGLRFLTEHGVRLDAVFSEKEKEAIVEHGGPVYEVMKNFGFNRDRNDLVKGISKGIEPAEESHNPIFSISRKSMMSYQLNNLRDMARELAEKNLQQYPDLFNALFTRVASDLGYPIRKATYEETLNFLREMITQYHVDVNSVFKSDLPEYWMCLPSSVQKEVLNLLVQEAGMNINLFLGHLADKWEVTLRVYKLARYELPAVSLQGAGPYETLRLLLEDFRADLTSPVPSIGVPAFDVILASYEIAEEPLDSQTQELFLKHDMDPSAGEKPTDPVLKSRFRNWFNPLEP